jgi:hypothetical protein
MHIQPSALGQGGRPVCRDWSTAGLGHTADRAEGKHFVAFGRGADLRDNVADSVLWIEGRHCLSDLAATSTLVISACGLPARVGH